MAFRRRTSRSRSYSGSRYRRRSYSSAPRRRATRRRSSPRQQTVRIVLEQPQQQLARDFLQAGVLPNNTTPRKAQF